MAIVLGVREETDEDKKKFGYRIERGYTGTEAQTAIVPTSTAALSGLQVDALEKRVERYHIPPEQVDAVTKLLEASRQKDIDSYKEADEDAYEGLRKQAIVAYKKQHPFLERITKRKKHKGWKDRIVVPIPASERTELLESIVTTRDIVLEGYQRFKKLPGILQKTYKDYSELQSREKSLRAEIESIEAAIKDAPAEIGACEQVIETLSRYETLSADEKQKVQDAVAEGFGRQSMPSLEVPAIRKRVIDRFSEAAAQRQLNAMNYNANLELARQEIESVAEQQKLIEEQMQELSQTWLPTLKHIDAARMRYDSMSRFAESAAEIIGMNKLRARNVEANAEAQAAIQRVLCVQAESRMIAEAVEQGAEEVRQLYAHKTKAADKIIHAEDTIEVPAEPLRAKRA